MSAGRKVWVKIRASEAERSEWHAKARAVGLSLSDLVRRSVGRVRTWTVAHTELEREAHPRAGADRLEPEPDCPLGQYPQRERRGAGGGRASGRHRAGARHVDRRGGTAMMIKFLARGTGSAAAAADYLTREQNLAPEQDQDQDQDRDPEKNPEEVKVLRGNPHQVADVADALQFEHKYTSGVIAWAPEDKPSDAQIGRVLDEFEKTAWAGLEPDRYAWAAVQHREAGGGVHVHVLAARCDLETGKSLNIAAPGWQKTFDALRDWQNHENGWSRPDDPERARDVQPGHRAYIEAAQLRAGLAVEKDPRRLITDYLSQGIETGAVSDRATMISALQRAGLEVPRQGKHYLTAADPESGGKWRLKGAIYERDFQRERLTSAAPEEGRAGSARDRSTDSERAEEARRQLEAERATTRCISSCAISRITPGG